MYNTPPDVRIEACPDLAEGGVPTTGVDVQVSLDWAYLKASALAVVPSVPPNITMTGTD